MNSNMPLVILTYMQRLAEDIAMSEVTVIQQCVGCIGIQPALIYLDTLPSIFSALPESSHTHMLHFALKI